MNLLKEREERYRKRKEAKKRHDSEINLSYTDDNKEMVTLKVNSVKELSVDRIRLLDEGAVEDGSGRILFFIEKGTIEKFLNGGNRYLDNITDDFEGHVDLGHMDFATFPYIIGSWKKEDLHLVDIENGRKAVDVDLHLDEESIFVKELARQPYDIGVSAEFYVHLDFDKMADFDYAFEIIDEIQIVGYALVGECGNVNSDGLELKGQEEMKEPEKDMKVTEVDEPTEETKEVEESVEETTEDIENEEATEAEDDTEGEAEEAEGEEGEEEAEEAEGEEGEAEEALDTEEAEDIDLSVVFDEMNKQLESLKAENEALKKQNKKLSKRLKAKNEEIEKFTSKFKGLSVSLGLKKEEEQEVAPKEKEHRLYAGNDGIGE